MLLFEKEKTILEIQAQKILMYWNIAIISFISSIAAIWFSSDFIFKTFQWKIVISVYLFLLFIESLKVFSIHFKKIETKIRIL